MQLTPCIYFAKNINITGLYQSPPNVFVYIYIIGQIKEFNISRNSWDSCLLTSWRPYLTSLWVKYVSFWLDNPLSQYTIELNCIGTFSCKVKISNISKIFHFKNNLTKKSIKVRFRCELDIYYFPQVILLEIVWWFRMTWLLASEVVSNISLLLLDLWKRMEIPE